LGLIFRSALPEELDWNTRAEDVALSLDAIKRCLTNMLVALDRDTLQTKQGPAPPTNSPTQEPSIRKYVSNGQEWEEADDEDCWGVNYTEPTAHMKAKIECILYTWGEEQPEAEQDEAAKQTPERERFSVPHASRD